MAGTPREVITGRPEAEVADNIAGAGKSPVARPTRSCASAARGGRGSPARASARPGTALGESLARHWPVTGQPPARMPAEKSAPSGSARARAEIEAPLRISSRVRLAGSAPMS